MREYNKPLLSEIPAGSHAACHTPLVHHLLYDRSLTQEETTRLCEKLWHDVGASSQETYKTYHKHFEVTMQHHLLHQGVIRSVHVADVVTDP